VKIALYISYCALLAVLIVAAGCMVVIGVQIAIVWCKLGYIPVP
jgi:hypothetical protein